MSDNVQFDTDQEGMPSGSRNFTSRQVFGQPQVPGVAAWLMKKGIIKNESSARGVLISIVIADFVVAGLIIYFFVLK